MLSNIVTKKLKILSYKLEESRILFIYRYISLLITSLFYILNNAEHNIMRKIIIIGCLTISAAIVSNLYLNVEYSDKNIKLLLLIETIGNTVLLIPSGGINSPFIWYTLNTILISSVYLNWKYCWFNLLGYFLCYSTIISITSNIDIDLLRIVKDEPNLVLSFIMIIAAVQVWSIYISKTKEKSIRLEEVNYQLESANKMIMESMEHIKALYQTVNILTNQGNKEGLISLLFEHIKSITKTNTLFYYDIFEDPYKMILEGDRTWLEALEKNIAFELQSILDSKIPKEICVYDTRFVVIPIKVSHVDYGVMGVEASNNIESAIYKNNIYQLQFLSELISIAFERLSLEEINDRLLISEEQNRIANEIHDSVLQRLFSMSCGVFSLIRKLDTYSKEEIENELNIFRKTTDSTMKELRDTVYGLSWKKSGYNSFSINIKKYIDDIQKMNNINIPFITTGCDEQLTYKQKKAIYRIICESIGNAFRHGKASNIEVNLNIDADYTVLQVNDDGIGFDLNKVIEQKTRGLGLENLYQLTKYLNGELTIDSELGTGTKIVVKLPNNSLKLKGEGAV